MDKLRKVKTALISVSDKKGLVEFASSLIRLGVGIISTGGTAKLLRQNNIKVTEVSDYTGFPEIMDGRVKTLHPKIHGGILAVRGDNSHESAMNKHHISGIDMVVVNLYPFEDTVKKGGTFDECVENIDIGGPAMIRSAAKNHKDVVVVVNPGLYQKVIDELESNQGKTSEILRRELAEEAFSHTARYDSVISNWFSRKNVASEDNSVLGSRFGIFASRKSSMRYGENPHQQAALYILDQDAPGAANARQVQGKELSYNNIADTDAAYDLVSEFEEPTVAIIKHANPCGVASAGELHQAYERALACDPVSAFGGIIALNRPLDAATAELISGIFVEVIIAPDADRGALKIISKKKNLRLLLTGSLPSPKREETVIKTVSGGFLLQTRDNIVLDKKNLKTVTKREPSREEINDMIFAFTVCKHVKSNAIVIAKNKATIGIGAGQMSRVDSSRIAAWKSREVADKTGGAEGAVLASDAFFPFADGLISAAECGVSAVMQPGGSIRDDEVIKAADERDIAMVFTGIRHFRH